MLDKDNQDVEAAKNKANEAHRLPTLRFYSDEFVFDTVSGMFFRLSSTAGFLLRSLNDGAEIDHLANLLQAKYGIDHTRAARDVELFLNDVSSLGILIQPGVHPTIQGSR